MTVTEHLEKALQAICIVKDKLVGNGADKVLAKIFDNIDKFPPNVRMDPDFIKKVFGAGIRKVHDGKIYRFELVSRGES